ncbi:MAG: hypothetical protein ACRDX8_10260 [Acidimicrobiales bacterium]
MLSAERQRAGFDVLVTRCSRALRARLAKPPRSDSDWSITLPRSCSCKLCAELAEFLGDPAKHSMEWPLAKPGRSHIHSRIDASELPVSHQTRRAGRPYTLVLVKTEALFDRERSERGAEETSLAWLQENWGG